MTLWQRLHNWHHIRKHGYPSRTALLEAYIWRTTTKMIFYGREVDPLGRKTSTWSVTKDYVFNYNTLEEVAAVHVITRERVRQMLHKALREYKKRLHT